MAWLSPLIDFRGRIFDSIISRYTQTIAFDSIFYQHRAYSTISYQFHSFVTALSFVANTILVFILHFIFVALFNWMKKYPRFLAQALFLSKAAFIFTALFLVVYSTAEFPVSGRYDFINELRQNDINDIIQNSLYRIERRVHDMRFYAAFFGALILPIEWLSQKEKART